MASVMGGLLPEMTGVQFTARPALRTQDSARPSARNGRSSSLGSSAGSGILSANASLSSIEIEALLREKVRANPDSIKQALMTYDVDQTYCVTKGEFRRVIESFCTPLTTDQFEAVLAKVDKNPNGTIRYSDFFDKFYGKSVGPPMSAPSRAGQRDRLTSSNGQRFGPSPLARELNVDMIEKLLKEKIGQNLKSVVKALQLFDYNRDGRIQRHEMRRVVENYCFKLSDQQFDKLWQRYDFHHTGLVNYKEFLERLGVSVQKNRPPLDGAKGAMNWQQAQSNPQLRSFKQRRDDELALQTLNFNQIELEFRKRMKDNYLNLKKAFMTFDKKLDGFISVDDLQSILTQFTIPMSTQLFSQLMDKCGVRGTGKISWENFLNKFQDQHIVGNGQTLPIKPNHKFFPIREGLKAVPADDIWRLLYKHVQNNYSSIKHAFLQFDSKRKGKVTRTELKNVLEKFTIHMEEDQFKELMLKLDPHHTNSISYQQFLQLFEETDSLEVGHKWLNSVHRVNEDMKPAIMAWETIEELLRDKITEYWKNVSSALLDYDYKGDGHISLTNLKKVIDNYVLPITDDHFQSMVDRCQDRTEKRINYVEFLERLKVDVRPGDLQGLSTQIFEGSINRERKRQDDLNYRNCKIVEAAHIRTTEMTADEVVVRLKDRMSQHSQKFREAFLSYDKRGRGLVSKRDFRQVLASFGMIMADEQFNILVSRLNFNKGLMQYSDFIGSFDDPRIGGGPSEDIVRSGNHRVNPIRGDEYGMSIEQVEAKLRSKLRENFSNLRGAFYKFDENHTGNLTKTSFRRLLDSFMCVMSDEQFEMFCNKHGITKKSRISYPEFLDRFEVRDTAEGHKWLNSVHRYNQVQPTPEMAAEDAFDLLKMKAHRQWKDLSQAFIKVGSSKNGMLKKKDLRLLLQCFVMPVPPEEFNKLWDMFDDDKKGYISYEMFLYKIGASEFTPGDLFGMSTKIIDHSRKTLEDHNEGQQVKHERITENQATRTGFMTVEQVETVLRDKIRDGYEGFNDAFRKYDTSNKGYLSISEIQKVLVDFNLFLEDDQFFHLLDRCGLTTNKSKLSYEAFLHSFEEGRKSSYGRRQQEVQITEIPSMSPAEAEHKLRESVATQVEVLERAFAAFDKDHTSRITIADFRRVLDLFCFKMTDSQWKCVVPKLQVVGDRVNYVMFLESYTMSEQEDSERWLASLQKSLNAQSPTVLALEDLQQSLREAVSAHTYVLAQAFTDCDYANLGVLSKEDFKSVLEKNVFRLSDEQFDSLWSSLTVNEFGNLDYHSFLKRYSSDPQPSSRFPPPTPQTQRLGSTLFGKRPESLTMRRSVTRLDMPRPGTLSRSNTRIGTPMVNAEFAESVVKNTIYKNWKQIQQQCRQKDGSNSGTINVVDLKEILVKYGVDLQGDEYLNLMTKYDLKENGTFCYVDFLRHFILNLKPQEETSSRLARRRLHTPQVVRSAGDTNVQFFDAMMRLRDTVSEHWKEMRRAFRNVDQSALGLIDSSEFRKVLRQFSVNLTEDEFYHLLSYYDKEMDGKICYNDFVRAYLNRT